MNKLIEIAAMALGSLSLFAVCFLGFAVMSGTPMHEVGLIGQFFEAPPTDDDDGEAPAAVPNDRPLRPQAEVIESNMELLSVWTLPAPYSEGELKSLADELKARQLKLDMRSADLDLRQRELEDQNERVQQRFESLDELRANLDAFEQELIRREEEVLDREKVEGEKQIQKWSSIAKLVNSMKEPEKRKELLAQYDADEVGRILHAMGDPAGATKVLAGLSDKIDAALLKEYAEAYSQASGSSTP